MNLRELILDECEIGDAGCIEICESLMEAERDLILLDLSHNDIGKEGGIKIAALLEKNTNLQKLYLHNNKIGAEASENIANGVKMNSVVTILDLSYCHLGRRKLPKGEKSDE